MNTNTSKFTISGVGLDTTEEFEIITKDSDSHSIRFINALCKNCGEYAMRPITQESNYSFNNFLCEDCEKKLKEAGALEEFMSLLEL